MTPPRAAIPTGLHEQLQRVRGRPNPERADAPEVTGAPSDASRNGKTADSNGSPGASPSNGNSSSATPAEEFPEWVKRESAGLSREEYQKALHRFEKEGAKRGLSWDAIDGVLTKIRPSEPPSRKTGTAAPSRRLTHQQADKINPSRPEWHWPRWLVAGNLHLLVGRQGYGKTTFAAWLVAQLSTGRAWPGESDKRTPLRCAMLSLEEPPDRVVARLHAAGADLSQVTVCGPVSVAGDPEERPWRLPADCGLLGGVIAEKGIDFFVIDGLGHSVTGDSHNYANVGSALSALSAMASATSCTILGLTHPPKGPSESATAAIGSTAWTAIPRIVWVLGSDPTDPGGERRVVRPSKSNYQYPATGLSFVIENDETWEAGRIARLDASEVAADDITAPPERPSDGDRSKNDEAEAFLIELLSSGPVLAKECKTRADESGIATRTLERAKKNLGVESKMLGTRGAWMWTLPEGSAQSRQGVAEPVGETAHGETGDTGLDQVIHSLDDPCEAQSRHRSLVGETGETGELARGTV